MISAAIAFVLLFFVQNVFSQQVYTPVHYQLSSEVVAKLGDRDMHDEALADLVGRESESAGEFSDAEQARSATPGSSAKRWTSLTDPLR